MVGFFSAGRWRPCPALFRTLKEEADLLARAMGLAASDYAFRFFFLPRVRGRRRSIHDKRWPIPKRVHAEAVGAREKPVSVTHDGVASCAFHSVATKRNPHARFTPWRFSFSRDAHDFPWRSLALQNRSLTNCGIFSRRDTPHRRQPLLAYTGSRVPRHPRRFSLPVVPGNSRSERARSRSGPFLRTHQHTRFRIIDGGT